MWFAIWFSMIYLVADGSLTMLNGPSIVLIPLYACSPLVVLWVVFAILKDGNPPSKTFDDFFYQDEEIRKLPG